jgi:hypothetical protein
MKKYIYFLHCKKNTMLIGAIILIMLSILFIYSYIENRNIDNKQIEKFGNMDDPLFKLVTCNEDPFLNCGNENIRIINGTCEESYGIHSDNLNRDKFRRCVNLRISDPKTLTGNIEDDIRAQTCNSYNSRYYSLQNELTYENTDGTRCK